MMTLPGAVNRGVKTANFRVLRKAAYPAVLVECGFLSNPVEAKRCSNNGYRDKIAEKIAEALIERISKIEPTAPAPPTIDRSGGSGKRKLPLAK